MRLKMLFQTVIALGSGLSLVSCSLVGDAVDISNRRSKAVAQGTVVQGDGFRVKAPEEGLYPTMNTPGKGGVTFRPVEPMLDGLVYFVTPFPVNSPSPAQALDEWNKIPVMKGHQVQVIQKRNSNYGGHPSTEALMEVPHPGGGQIAAVLIVKTRSGYLVLNRGDRYYGPSQRDRAIKRSAEGLKKLLAATAMGAS